MKRLTCEMCGSYDLVKQDGVFVCQHCDCKYSLDEAKKMMGMGTSEGGGSTVKIHTSDELATLFQLARKAKADNNSEEAAQYYKKIVEIETSIYQQCFSWEACFFDAYFKSVYGCSSNTVELCDCLARVFHLIKSPPLQKYILDDAEQQKAVEEVAKIVIFYSSKLLNGPIIDPSRFYCSKLLFIVGDCITSNFGDKYVNLAVKCWKLGLEQEIPTYNKNASSGSHSYDQLIEAYRNINEHIDKIKKYDSSYNTPKVSAPKAEYCYVATAVYGSYDCPQVWTLRRYRDYTLAETWYGRAFIRTYYAISPTLVKWFGHTDWFKNMWKGTLDRMVADLNASGVEDSPYEDKVW